MYKAIHSVLQCMYMKTPKTFRLSEEAVKVLDEQPNATEFLESLILNQHKQSIEVVPLQQLKEVLRELSHRTINSHPTVRTPADVLRDIEQAKLELHDLLEVNQDPNDHAQQQTKIQNLWEEYNSLKEQHEETHP
jgi:hypothetical protein